MRVASSSEDRGKHVQRRLNRGSNHHGKKDDTRRSLDGALHCRPTYHLPRAMFDAIEILMAVGPALGYVDQLRMFHTTRTSRGFPLSVPAILLISSFLRISFWFGKRFDPVLLIQSCLMVLMQFFLLQAAVKYREVPVMSSEGFWKWPAFSHYVRFLILFGVGLTGLHVLMEWSSVYMELIGVLALGIEATLPVPQVMENYRRKSTKGFSSVLLAAWCVGDAFKTYYYFRALAPLQFVACGVFQLTMDCVLVAQMMLYKPKMSRI